MLDHQDSAAARLSMRRLFWLPLVMSALLVMAVAGGMVAFSWRTLNHLQPLSDHLAHIARLQEVGLSLEQILLEGLRGTRIDPTELTQLRAMIRQIARLEGALHPQTRERLEQIAERLEQGGINQVDVLIQTLAQWRGVLEGERARHDALLLKVARDTRMELRLTSLLLVILPLLMGVALIMLQRRVQQPLRDLETLLTRLAARDYQPVPEAQVNETAKLARPAFNRYNALVSRLQQLESEQHDREQTLERRVHQTTEALLAQNRELARAERLAAVGAVSAGLAHELRNPLAGIQMVCANLQRRLGPGEHAERIASVIEELKRINTILSAQVDAARHEPEPLVAIEVGALIEDLLVMVRYQTPAGIRLETRIPAALTCLLPAAGLRQALLNLLLNAIGVLREGEITLAAHAEADRLVIRVLDTGPGFPQALLRTGIRPFATGRAGGTGLGLAMVRRFARDQDGELAIANQPSGGACVTLRLPCRSAASTGVERHA
jgi:two-component system, NtrC family, sensor kinase